MTTLNWNIFKAKFHQRENKVFESLAYCLFCYELGIRIGVFRFKNQTGIETEPIEPEGKKLVSRLSFMKQGYLLINPISLILLLKPKKKIPIWIRS